MTALQDWLNIRHIDPRNHVKALIDALRSVTAEKTADTTDEPALIARGVERC